MYNIGDKVVIVKLEFQDVDTELQLGDVGVIVGNKNYATSWVYDVDFDKEKNYKMWKTQIQLVPTSRPQPKFYKSDVVKIHAEPSDMRAIGLALVDFPRVKYATSQIIEVEWSSEDCWYYRLTSFQDHLFPESMLELKNEST
jgi:hypothetical protein